MKTIRYVLVAALLVALSGTPASAVVVGEWDFNEDGVPANGYAIDSALGGIHADAIESASGTSRATEGTLRYAITDGLGLWNAKNGLNGGNEDYFFTDTESFSAQVWFRLPEAPNPSPERFLIGKANFGANTSWAMTVQNNGANLRLNYYLGGIDHFQPTTLGDDGLNVWHHMGLIYDGVNQQMRTYHNGALLDVANGNGSNYIGNVNSLHLAGNANPANSILHMDHARLDSGNIGDAGMLASYNGGVAPNSVAAGIPGDINGDGQVDGLDLNLLGADWQSVSPVTPEADINGDGIVDGLDLNILGGNWQVGVPAPGAAIPEPASLALLGIGAIAMLRRSRA
jgi:hypothetical protein